ncbi:uncharacterized protein Z519_05819 [Cladophialophora bantiana CBS 173.52]|uniref:Uncharacterized protein n=1 Tax=Cladophialophora bantiana (strain ATCC 10958 / CBS 173.52 / CDC B-1940 / NIH 8579) TaxID=1442370 RepID=A0A0D2I8U7_CLAB1|nr:uncharacterized protein Z519_05819 [Cladophialophora bantiana CBS 173.52]KIW93214.1 hypothetical protein Z519_05819 [Cladophialophora bantiana CBS 173.52]
MPRNPRTSSAHDAAEWEAEDVTAILNEEAANSTRSPPRKRKRESRGGPHAIGPWNKRIQLDEPPAPVSDAAIATTASPSRRQSRRLQARKSLSAPNPVNRCDLLETPNDRGPEAVTKVSLKPVKKLRRLNKRPEEIASPFKGKGILETKTNALVNLDDSPRKRPVRNRIEKIGRSLHKGARLTNKPKARGATRGREAFDSEDIFKAFQRESLGRNSPELGRPFIEEVPTKSSKQSSSKLRLPAKPTREAGGEIERNLYPLAKSSNPLAEAARQIPAEETSEAYLDDDVVEESQGEAEDNAANEEHTERAEKHTQGPRTQAERNAAEQTAAEAGVKRKQMIKDALSGIEVAVQVHNCKDAWTDSLVAAAEIAESRASSGPESIKGKACAREFKKMAQIYKKLYRENTWYPGGLNREERGTLGLLKRRCKHICDYHYRPDMRFDLERKRMVRDLYEHLIPSSLELAKRALKACFQNDRLSMTALREICQLLKITAMLVKSARDWKPRPELGNAVKSKTKSDITRNVETIVEKYCRAIDEDERERFVDELELRQKQNLERQLAEYERRREAVRAKHRQYHGPDYQDDAVIPGRSVSRSKPNSVDIDNIPVGDEQAVRESHHDEETGHAGGSAVRTRPRTRREPTEDIPPPAETQWDQSELIMLVNALQEFTGESRWEDIIDEYGGPRGVLQRYDMDQIMAKARWVKQTMARRLEGELDESWDWLRSVPD